MYVTTPNASLGTVAPVTDTAVLYLTDVFGINLTENRLYVFNLLPLADKTPHPPPPSRNQENPRMHNHCLTAVQKS